MEDAKETTNELLHLLEESLESLSIKEIAKKLDVASGTIKRWMELKSVPSLYRFDIMKLKSNDIDYSKFTSKEKDQFFTPTDVAKHCYDVLCDKLSSLNIDVSDYMYIEPSAGDGSFLKVLPSNRVSALDIEPRAEGIMKQDYLTWQPTDTVETKYIVIGNPPFGLRGNLALRFMNHSANFADFVAFILPPLFESDGKGVPRKRIKEYNLIHSEKLNTSFYDPEKKDIKINVVFQIWAKNFSNNKYDIKKANTDVLRVYSLSDGGTPSSTRNKKMLDRCDVYLPSTCYGNDKMKCYTSFNDLPDKRGYGIVFTNNREEMIKKCLNIDWVSVSFLSTNSALNLRTSLIYSQFT